MKQSDEPELDFKFMQQTPNNVPEVSTSEGSGSQLSFRFLGVAEDAKPDCADSRLLNRVLVIYHEMPTTETVREKICDEMGCRFVNRTIQRKPEACLKVLAELKKLEPKWLSGSKECCHFRLINADDPDSAKLIKELDVKRSDMPMLIKETDQHKRKKAHGMSSEDLAKWWNKQFLEPKAEPEAKPAAKSGQTTISETCVPGTGSFLSGPNWDFNGQGNLRAHLTDPRSPHHLPYEVVNGIGPNKMGRWSDAQVQAWHNWHHEALRGNVRTASPAPSPSRAVQPVRAGAAWQSVAPKLKYASGSREERIAQRITQIVAASVKSGPPAQMMAQAGSSKKNRITC